MTVDDDSRITRAFLDHEADLGRFLAQMVRDRELANDLLQDTWLAVVSSRGALPSEEAMVPWLFGIARNRALTALRGRRRAMEALRRLTTAVRPAVVDPRAGDADALRDFLESVLGAEDRSLFLLRYVFGFSSEELARMTGRSSSAVRKRLSRAAQTVADALDRADLIFGRSGASMDDRTEDAVFSDLIAGLRRIEPASRELASGERRRQPTRRRLLAQVSVFCALAIAGTAVGVGTGTIPFGSWTTYDGNTYVDTSGDGTPDEIHARPTSGGRLTCSLVGLTASEANRVLKALDLRPEWRIGLVRESAPFVTADGGIVSRPPRDAPVSDFLESDGVVRITVDVGRHAPNAAPTRQPGTCETPTG